MDSKSEHKSSGAVLDRFLGAEDVNLLCNGFDGSNEERIVRQQELRSYSEMKGNAV